MLRLPPPQERLILGQAVATVSVYPECGLRSETPQKCPDRRLPSRAAKRIHKKRALRRQFLERANKLPYAHTCNKLGQLYCSADKQVPNMPRVVWLGLGGIKHTTQQFLCGKIAVAKHRQTQVTWQNNFKWYKSLGCPPLQFLPIQLQELRSLAVLGQSGLRKEVV